MHSSLILTTIATIMSITLASPVNMTFSLDKRQSDPPASVNCQQGRDSFTSSAWQTAWGPAGLCYDNTAAASLVKIDSSWYEDFTCMLAAIDRQNGVCCAQYDTAGCTSNSGIAAIDQCAIIGSFPGITPDQSSALGDAMLQMADIGLQVATDQLFAATFRPDGLTETIVNIIYGSGHC